MDHRSCVHLYPEGGTIGTGTGETMRWDPFNGTYCCEETCRVLTLDSLMKEAGTIELNAEYSTLAAASPLRLVSS